MHYYFYNLIFTFIKINEINLELIHHLELLKYFMNPIKTKEYWIELFIRMEVKSS